jgi:hypothetical protein
MVRLCADRRKHGIAMVFGNQFFTFFVFHIKGSFGIIVAMVSYIMYDQIISQLNVINYILCGHRLCSQ